LTNWTFINLHHGHPFIPHLSAFELSAHFSVHYPSTLIERSKYGTGKEHSGKVMQ
jgi:hypothetical protein